jgi:phosphatidylglycerol:prolipoprotein diacylglycerol transferase
MAIPFPDLDPVAIGLGPLAIRWYALAYITGLLGGWKYMRWLVSKPPHLMRPELVDDFITWATLGVVLGGRLGYVLFYKPGFYAANPLEIFYLWRGGMSFHGGALGVILAIILFARQQRISMLGLGDMVCMAEPIGQFFGRIANFINGELWGRQAPDDLPWAMVFPTDDQHLPRHPSQLYEAGLEGLALFVVLFLLWRVPAVRNRPGTLAGVFLLGYGVARIICEFFRQPDAFLGFLWGGASMGQLLSIPLLIAGSGLIVWAQKRKTA